MKGKNIRNLFDKRMLDELKRLGSGGKLLYPFIKEGEYQQPPETIKSYISTRLMPSPSFSETLAGREHTCYNGIFRFVCRSTDRGNGNKTLDEMVDVIGNLFYTDMVLSELRTDPDIDPFTVQIITPLTVSEPIRQQDGGQWWEVKCSLQYRSDVYTPIDYDPNNP